MAFRILLILFLVALHGACATSSSGKSSATLQLEVVEATQAWQAAFNSRDPARITAMYAPDAVFWGTTMKSIATHPAAVAEYFQDAGSRPSTRVVFEEQHIRVYGDMAINSGTYTFKDVRDGQATSNLSRYTLVFRKQQGNWLIVNHHSSRMPPSDDKTQQVAPDARQPFWASISELCGKAFAGRIAVNEGGGAGPDPFEGKSLTMHVRECSQNEIHVPFHVGDDRSRTWVFTRTSGLRLKHDHRHQDGSPDAVTLYGGDASEAGNATEQRFPADTESKEMFIREGRTQSVENTWVVSLVPGKRFSYALVRPGREFRVDFDLTQPVEAPPAPWGR